jgi:uncharacterized protein
MTSAATHPCAPAAELAMRRWLERAVIGLNLCPFAKGVYVKGQLHLAFSPAETAEDLLTQLESELDDLVASDPSERDTTLLVAPGYCPQDFLGFNDLLVLADRLLADKGLVGTIQIASFHPQFQFAGTQPEDMGNFTNRAPYPALHLLREASIERAVQGFGDTETIYQDNIRTLERLGPTGWAALNVGATP